MFRRPQGIRILAGLTLWVLVWALEPAGGTTRNGVDPLVREGIEAYRAGSPVYALRAFAEATSKAPGDALPALWAGAAAAAAGRWKEAEAYFREALRRPHTPEEGRLAQDWLARLEALGVRLPKAVDSATGIAALAHASNPRLTWGQARWLGLAVEAAARREGIDPWLLASVIYIESRFNHQSVSWAGAMGLGQLMPQTAHAAGVDPRDPWQNVLGAAEILRWNYLQLRSWPLALAGYNAGGDAVRRYGGIPPYAETQWYVRAVLWVYSQLRGTAVG
jgi:soluble lytic murein transglycosylase-like protein